MAMNDDKKLRDTYLKQYSDGIEETRLSCSKAANAEFLVTLYYISKYLHPGVRVIEVFSPERISSLEKFPEVIDRKSKACIGIRTPQSASLSEKFATQRRSSSLPRLKKAK